MRYVTIALLTFIAACGGAVDSHEDGLDETVDAMEELIEVLEGVTDKASAEDAKDEIEKLADRINDIKEQMEKLPQPTGEEQARLAKLDEEKIGPLMQRFMAAAMKVASNPEIRKILDPAMKKMKG